jgi:hypothetical protein
MVEEAARGWQTLAMVQALAALLDQGIARGEGGSTWRPRYGCWGKGMKWFVAVGRDWKVAGV